MSTEVPLRTAEKQRRVEIRCFRVVSFFAPHFCFRFHTFQKMRECRTLSRGDICLDGTAGYMACSPRDSHEPMAYIHAMTRTGGRNGSVYR